MKPSNLLKLALKDLQKCEEDPQYKIDMNHWVGKWGGKCHVCLAGAVLVQTVKVKSVGAVTKEWDRRIDALNSFREGRIALGLSYLKWRSRTLLNISG